MVYDGIWWCMMVYDEERGGEQWAMNCFFGYLQEVYDGIDSCDGYVNLLIYLEQGTPNFTGNFWKDIKQCSL